MMVVRFSPVDEPEKPPGDPPEKAEDTEAGTNGEDGPTTKVLELM